MQTVVLGVKAIIFYLFRLERILLKGRQANFRPHRQLHTCFEWGKTTSLEWFPYFPAWPSLQSLQEHHLAQGPAPRGTGGCAHLQMNDKFVAKKFFASNYHSVYLRCMCQLSASGKIPFFSLPSSLTGPLWFGCLNDLSGTFWLAVGSRCIYAPGPFGKWQPFVVLDNLPLVKALYPRILDFPSGLAASDWQVQSCGLP